MTIPERKEPKDGREFWPTAPSTTKGFLDKYTKDFGSIGGSVWEPACGEGDMSRVLEPYADRLFSTDLWDHGYGESGVDFTMRFDPRYQEITKSGVDWVITNPPFNLWTEFVLTALEVARQGVALYAPTLYCEGVDRYERIYAGRRPHLILQHVRRQPWLKGQLEDEETKSAKQVAFMWLVWYPRQKAKFTVFDWIP